MDFDDSHSCSWVCSGCPSGRYSTNYTLQQNDQSCEICPTGYVQPISGQTFCTRCQDGTFAAQPGMVECQSSKIDPSLPKVFEGLRFEVTDDFHAAVLIVVWDQLSI